MICIGQKSSYNESQIIYLAICVMFVVKILSGYSNFHIEPIDMSVVKRILHPEYPQGGVIYGPHFHYNYIVAFAAKIFSYEANSSGLAMMFWVMEQALTLVILIKLCNLLFSGDRTVLVLAVFMYLMLKSGETDQKTMLRPLYFLAIYYFLKEKWLLSAIFSASLFYLHIGFAIWWFIPSCFALGIMFLLKKEQVSLRKMAKYSFATTIIAFPVFYFYLGMAPNTIESEFSTRYFYGVNNSLIMLLLTHHALLIQNLITIAVCFVGYSKWRKEGNVNQFIVPIGLGVLTLYCLNFVLVDLMSNSIATQLQLLRSVVNLELFMLLFLAFLIAKQIQRGAYIFFIMLLLLLIPNPFRSVFFIIGKWNAIYLFYVTVVIYEIFNSAIGNFVEVIIEYIKCKISINYLQKLTNNIHRFFQEPVKIAGFIIVLMIVSQIGALAPIRSSIKSTLGISLKKGVMEKKSKRECLYEDIVWFTNNEIKENGTLFVVPFYENDFEYYTNQRIFITKATPMYGSSVSKTAFVSKFQNIFENDLNYSIEKLREGGSWEDIWTSVDENLIRKWKKTYGITHVIREKELPLNFSVIYENEYYFVYKL